MLSHNEVVMLLAYIAASDRRTVGETDVAVWSDALAEGQVSSLPDAKTAVVKHIATSDAWLKPFHVINGVKRLRAERLRNGPNDEELMQGCDPDHPAYLAELRRRREAVATGQHVTLRAVEA